MLLLITIYPVNQYKFVHVHDVLMLRRTPACGVVSLTIVHRHVYAMNKLSHYCVHCKLTSNG